MSERESYYPDIDTIEPTPPPEKPAPPSLAEQYTTRLWERVEDLFELKAPLLERQTLLYKETEAMRAKGLNLHSQQIVAEKENEYWRLVEKVQEITGLEEQIAAALEEIEAGNVDLEKLNKLAPLEEEETEQLSKQKARIKEDKEKLGLSSDEIEWDLYYRFGSRPTNKLTTGRHQKKVSGNFNSFTAESAFRFHTADSHGGKIDVGKRGSYYTNANGKSIRKK